MAILGYQSIFCEVKCLCHVHEKSIASLHSKIYSSYVIPIYLHNMMDWYFNLSLVDRTLLWFLIGAYVFVFSVSFQALRGSPAVWYRAFYTTPVFQLLMWIAVLPLIIPFLFLTVQRSRKLSQAMYIGNLRSRIFHRPDCEYQRKISSPYSRYPLSSVEEAERLGFRACYVCYPGSSAQLRT